MLDLTNKELVWIVDLLEVDKFDRHQDDWYNMIMSEQEVLNLIHKLKTRQLEHAMYCHCDRCILERR